MTRDERDRQLFNLKRTKRGLVEIEKLYEEYTGVTSIDKKLITYQQMCDLILKEETLRGDFE